MQKTNEIIRYKVAYNTEKDLGKKADPVTTEVVRHALQSAVKQMKTVLVRTSFSPIVYEALDFSASLYDRQIRLLTQAETLPIFMGTMSFCIEEAVKAVGGEAALDPGDILLYNLPYGSGSHAQDAAIIEPVFLNSGELVGYSATKVHWGDIGAKNPYCTDTTDIFQEGLIFPGVKLYRRGERVDDIYRMILNNSRMVRMIKGDIHAQVASCRAGTQELVRIVERFGLDVFSASVERMLDHGEAMVRSFIEKLPDGRYPGKGALDNDGIDDIPIEFEIELIIEGSTVTVDYSKVPDALKGPLNCPFPTTACATRISVAMLAGSHLPPNEGSFRPIELITRPGSMFHPLSPAPCFLYGWPAMQAMDAMDRALANAFDNLVPSGSAADICAADGFGYQPDTGEPFFCGNALPVGHGAHAKGDGATLYVSALSHSTLPSAELQEIKFPMLFERWEFITDSCGPGKYRGGMGFAYHWQILVDVELLSALERTKIPSWGQQGGGIRSGK